MKLTPRSRDAIRRDWAERLGCEPGAFEQRGVTLAETANERSVRLLRRNDATVVAANPTVREALVTRRSAVVEWPLLDADGLLGRALDDGDAGIAAVHGPVVLAYVDATAFAPVDSDARLLTEADAEAFETLRERVPADEWAQASPTFRAERTAGLFLDDELVAVATLTEAELPDVGVVVAPEHRDEGLGRAVVSRVLEAAFDRDGGLVARYRTPETATASHSLAAALGFERWASETVVVLA